MAGAGEEGVPVWGIDVGPEAIQAARVVRRSEGGFFLLDYREAQVQGPAPEALVSFLRKTKLLRRPIVVAIRSPASRLATVVIDADQRSTLGDDVHLACLDHVHPEPEFVDLRSTSVTEELVLISAEERARVEGFLMALEGAQAPAYGIVGGLDALVGTVRRSGVFAGDALVLRVRRSWTDLVFLDGDRVRHLGIPFGERDVEDEASRTTFAEDVGRCIEYHRAHVPREEPERILLLGLSAEAAEKLAPLLPERPVAFPEDAGPIRGKGRIGTMRAMEIIRTAPDAVGAAIAGAAVPRRLELAFHHLPETLPGPPRPVGAWFTATLLLWAALGLAWAGASRDVSAVREALAGLEGQEDMAEVRPATLTRLRSLVSEGRNHAAFTRAVQDLFRVVPGAGDGPYRTDEIAITRADEGAMDVEVVFTLPGERGGPGSPCHIGLLRIGAEDVRWEVEDGHATVRARWRVEARK